MSEHIENKHLDKMLRECLASLRPYGNKVILVGGLATFFYPHLSGYEIQQAAPVATLDIDLAIGKRLEAVGAKTISQSLREVGFEKESHIGTYATQASHYFTMALPGNNQTKERIDIISPMIGKPTDEPNHPQNDLIVDALRYVDLLLEYAVEFNHPVYGKAYVPHPLTFVMQKLLIRNERKKKQKHKKDQYDLFATLWSFHQNWADWGKLLGEICLANDEWKSWAKTFAQSFGTSLSQ